MSTIQKVVNERTNIKLTPHIKGLPMHGLMRIINA